MPFEPDGFRPGAVAVPELPIAGLVAACLGDQCVEPQQWKFVVEEHRLGGHSRQPVNGLLGGLQIAVPAALQQCFDQNRCRPTTVDAFTTAQLIRQYAPAQVNGSVVVSGSGFLGRIVEVNADRCDSDVAMLQNGITNLMQQLEPAATRGTIAADEGETQCESGIGELKIVSGPLGDSQRLGHFANCSVVRQ